MILAVFPFIAGLFSFILGLVVLIVGADTKNSKWSFVLFAGSVGVWAVFISLFMIVKNAVAGEIFVGIYYVAALLIAYAFLVFSLSYSGVKLSHATSILALLPWAILSGFIVVPGMFISSVEITNKTVQLESSYYIIYSAIFVLYVSIGLGYMAIKAFRNRYGAHLRTLTVALFICILGGSYFNLLMPLFGNYSLIIFGPLFSFFMVFSVFYSIAKHGLFDIRLAFVRTVTYVLSLSTLAAVYVVVAYIIFNQILGQTSTISQILINVGLTLTLAFLFQPVKIFFDHLTNSLFYKDGYSADDFYAALNKVLTSTTDLRSLLKRISHMLSDTFKSEQAFIFVFTEDRGFISSGTDDHSKLPYHDAQEIRNLTEIILPDSPIISKTVRRMMISHKIALIMPLIREHELIGYVCLGDHRTSTYSRRDRRVLRTIADELVIAIQNALSVQEVKDLNAHLEQRIDAATKELRTSNAQLQKLDEAKDEFISMASHQLRTPLTSIKGYISMIMDGDVGKISKDQKHLLEEAFMSSERMVRLISDFLNVSRLQTGKFIVDKHPVNLAKLVAQQVDALASSAAAHNLKFIYKKPKNIPEIELDENKIQQVIMNFCDNAIYYSKEHSKINVGLALIGNQVEFTVKDTGIGVPVTEQGQLFTKFFRATNARKQRPDGTGVGLFLAKKVVDAHDGKIVFESEEHKGSTFGFMLPVKKA
ncbi:MAG: GAF domain-containing protein [Candidatus Microsaccharimonas sossegonensis]|uniref:histidine kinase n=1 Tax=Candidatus Microsaccharimonas sossegonensis TaxID=2506948 RepID=A0A4Q0AGC5_9BACT|nr:MAG: GAF domain-containing protein [Candidatus Microsaccharimonas sossegonensis]